MTDLSILNLAPLRDGETFNQAIDNLVELAQLAERTGYTRYWIAEHHNMPYIWQVPPRAYLSSVCLTRQAQSESGRAVSCSPIIRPLSLPNSMARWQAYILTV
ncbi:LLM class flavin-dependent oxidoreductase [Moraxella bovis]|uniref:LLM class flavin-dependent oxidoreductase n=1 Tax=Moraxella bovis TaxID=476 RepID=UPI002467BE69|nr:LLM class flavin-dependent oxidoreductase [Moraxella bovis]